MGSVVGDGSQPSGNAEGSLEELLAGLGDPMDDDGLFSDTTGLLLDQSQMKQVCNVDVLAFLGKHLLTSKLASW